jgi:hypothetical protein
LPAVSATAFLALVAAGASVTSCSRSTPIAGGTRDAAIEWSLPGWEEEPPTDASDVAGEDATADVAPDAAPSPDAKLPSSQAVTALSDRLVLWLDAGQGVEPRAGSLSTWTDQSGRGNHAINPKAGNGGTPGLVMNAINGLPAVQFEADTDRLVVADSTSLHFGLDDVIAAVVMKHKSAQAAYSRIVLSKQQPQSPFIGLGLFVNWDNGFGAGAQLVYTQVAVNYSPPGGTFADDLPRLYLFRRAENQLELRVNGRSVGLNSALRSGSPVDLTNAASLNIGGQGSDFQALRGSIAEIVIVRGSVAGAELVALEEYLMAKYRL